MNLYIKKLQIFAQITQNRLLTYIVRRDIMIKLARRMDVLTAIRYAMKRKVAAGVAGNFRGVCPF